MKKIVHFLLITLSTSISFAQSGLQQSVLPRSINSQWYQPDNLGNMDDSIRIEVGLNGYGVMANNGFGLGTLLQGGNFITDAAKEKMLSQLPKQPRLQLGYGVGLVVNARIGKKIQGFYAANRTSLSIGTSNKELLGLIFRGNSHYLGQEIKDKDLFLNNLSWTELGWGIAGKWKKFSWGTKIKLLAGTKYTTIGVKDFSFFTSNEGDEIKVKGTYNFFQSAPKTMSGFGLGIDLGGSVTINSKLRLNASILDVGAISFAGNQSKKTIDLDWKGISLGNILHIDSTKTKNFIDSMKNVVLADTVKTSRLVSLPSTFHFTAVYQLNPHSQLFAGIHGSASRQVPRYALPMLNVGYQHAFKKYFTLGANVYGGGTDVYGIGAFAQFATKFKHKLPFIFYYEMNNVTGAIGFGKGISANTGISFGF